MKSLHHPESGTERINRQRKSLTAVQIQGIAGQVDAITSLKDREELSRILLKYFPGQKEKPIRDFFMHHPVRWYDLIRKLSKFRRNDSQHGWYLSEDGIEEIYTTFLILNRKRDIGEKLRQRLPDSISTNQELLRYASEQPSILDSGGFTFAQSPKRKHHIRKLIENAFIRNIEGCNHNNIQAYFDESYHGVLDYITEIFGLAIHLGYCKDITQLANTLDQMMRSDRGEEKENAFRVLQALFAWSGFRALRDMLDIAHKEVAHIVPRLKEADIIITGDISESPSSGATKYEAQGQFKKIPLRIIWRVKTEKSILQKQWESEEYTNADAIRDIIGISLIYPRDTPQSEVSEMISRVTSLMPNFGYILKNKGGIPDEEIDKIRAKAQSKGKSPVYCSKKKGGSSSTKFRNTSISGFLQYRSDAVGTEFQILDEESYSWKEKDDEKYKPRSAIEAFIRGTKFLTFGQILMILRKRMTLEEKPISILEVVYEMVTDGFLIPYISWEEDVILFTTKEKESSFQEKFPTMIRGDSSRKYQQIIVDRMKAERP